MKLLLQAWHANDLYSWAIAGAIVAGMAIAVFALKHLTLHALSVLSRRAKTPLKEVVVHVIRATRLWLLFPLSIFAGAFVVDLPQKLDHLIATLVVLGLMLQAALWVTGLVDNAFDRQIARQRGKNGEAVTTLMLLGIAARAAVWVIAVLLMLNHLNFDITALIAGLGIGGIAVALAVQNILGDLFASLSIVLDKPFVVGDFVVVGELRGTIERIGIKTTRVRSLDGELIVFSNADLLKSRIRNFKRMRERRIAFTIGVTYGTPMEKLARIATLLREIVGSQARARFDRAHFKTYGDFALLFEVVYYVLDPDYNVYMDVQQGINLEIFRRFEREGIEFAYPTQTVFLRRADGDGPPREAPPGATGAMAI